MKLPSFQLLALPKDFAPVAVVSSDIFEPYFYQFAGFVGCVGDSDVELVVLRCEYMYLHVSFYQVPKDYGGEA